MAPNPVQLFTFGGHRLDDPAGAGKTVCGKVFVQKRRAAWPGSSPEGRAASPPGLYRVLRQVVDALVQGLTVTVAPFTQVLTTQQAADLVGVSGLR